MGNLNLDVIYGDAIPDSEDIEVEPSKGISTSFYGDALSDFEDEVSTSSSVDEIYGDAVFGSNDTSIHPTENDLTQLLDIEDSWGTEKAAFFDGIQGTAPLSIGRLFESWLGDTLPTRVDFGDLPWTEEVEEGVTFSTTPDWLGISDDAWDQMDIGERSSLIDKTVKARIKERYKPDEESVKYSVINIGSLFLDPSIAIPAFAPSKAVIGGAAVAGIDNTLYQYSSEGEVDPKQLALAGALGAGGGKIYKTLQRRSEIKQAQKWVEGVNAEITQRFATAEGRKSSITIFGEIKEGLGLSTETVDKILETANKDIVRLSTKSDKKRARRTLLSMKMKQDKPRRGSGTFLGRSADRVFEPVGEAVKRISPKLHRVMRKLEHEEMIDGNNALLEVEPFLRQGFGFKSILSKVEQDDLHYMMVTAENTTDIAKIHKFVKDKGGSTFLKNYKSYRRAMERIYEQRNNTKISAGLPALGKIIGYTPRRVSSLRFVEESILADEILVKKYKKFLREAAEQLETTVAELSKADRVDILNRFLAKNWETTATSAKHRMSDLSKVNFLDGYTNLVDSTHKYIKESYQEIHRGKLFGKHLEEDNMEQTIRSYADSILKNTSADPTEVIDVLKHRYMWGPRSTTKALQAIKNAGYLTLLAHPTNAIRQLGDLALASYNNGIANTVAGMYRTLTGKKSLSPKEMGLITNKAHELTESTFGRKFLDWGMKFSGFSAVDALGKGAIMNGSIRKITKELNTIKGMRAFRKKWGEAFGEKDTLKLIEDFQKFRKGDKFFNKQTQEWDTYSPLMKELAFAEVSKFQPISMLEMPKTWLKHPNGRFFYMLQSFALKHVNVMRQDIFKEFRSGSKIKAVQNATKLASLFTLGNMGVDKINDLMLGKDRDLEELFFLNLFRNSGVLSKYDFDRIFSGKEAPVSSLANTFMPPLDPLAEGITASMRLALNYKNNEPILSGVKWEKITTPIPLIGRILSAWGYKAGLPPSTGSELPPAKDPTMIDMLFNTDYDG